jgi:hypothetical protein
MSDLPRLSDMHAATEQNLVDFLRTDLAPCATFADVVLTELWSGDRQAGRDVHGHRSSGPGNESAARIPRGGRPAYVELCMAVRENLHYARY